MFVRNLFLFITAMAIIKNHYEGITGGKICRRRVPFIPYNRPRSAARGICQPPPANEAGRSRWFTKKLFDSAAQLVVNSVSRLFSVFVKGIAATPGENTGAMEEVSKVPTDPSPILPSQFESSQIVKAAEKQKSSYEVREQGGNSVDIRLSMRYDGSDTSRQELISHIKSIFQLEEQLNQKRSELNKKEDLLLSRTTQQSTLKGVNFNALKRGSSDMDAGCTGDARRVRQMAWKPRSSDMDAGCTGDARRVRQMICEEGFESPIEIARAYLASKSPKATPYIFNSQKDKASALSSQFGNKLVRAKVASRSASCFPVIPVDSQSNKMAQEPRGISTLYKLSRSPHCRCSMMAKIKALKPYSSDMDAGCTGDARRVRQKFC